MKGQIIYISEMTLIMVSCVIVAQFFGLSAFCGSLFGFACALKLFASKKEKQNFTLADYYSNSLGWYEVMMQTVANVLMSVVAFILYRHSCVIAFCLGWGIECEVRLISNVIATKIYNKKL